jgi:hypothetical protein
MINNKNMNRVIRFLILTTPMLFAWCFCFSQEEATIILDLKKTRADYEIAKQKFENNKKLLDEKAISVNDFNQSKNELLSKEVDYQKLILKLISQQSYVIVEKATKYQDAKGNRRVRVTVKSTMEGNEEYLNQFKDHFDVFSPEMRSGKIYNVFVSLVNITDQTIIGSPYEYRIPSIELGNAAIADFELLKDMENLQVLLNYNGKKDQKNIYLEKDASVNIIDISSTQFSQEADLGSQAKFDLSLERFSSSDDAYKIVLLNLPRQITYSILDNESTISQIKFSQGVNTKKLILSLFMPDVDDENIVIDKPIKFCCVVLTNAEYDKIKDKINQSFSEKEINELVGGKDHLEIIPRGKGKIEVNAPSLYHEIKIGDSVSMKVMVKNAGTRGLNNIKVSLDMPTNWHSKVKPELIKDLGPNKEIEVQVTIVPPSDEGVGAQEVKIKTEALADNRKVESDDKTVRIQIESKTPVFWTIMLILLLIGLIVGIVIFGIRISKR